MRLSAGNLRFAPLRDEPGNDFFSVISLNFDDAVLTRSAGSAKPFEPLGRLHGFCDRKPVNERYDADATAFARDADDAVCGYRRGSGDTPRRCAWFGMAFVPFVARVDEFAVVFHTR